MGKSNEYITSLEVVEESPKVRPEIDPREVEDIVDLSVDRIMKPFEILRDTLDPERKELITHEARKASLALIEQYYYQMEEASNELDPTDRLEGKLFAISSLLMYSRKGVADQLYLANSLIYEHQKNRREEPLVLVKADSTISLEYVSPETIEEFIPQQLGLEEESSIDDPKTDMYIVVYKPLPGGHQFQLRRNAEGTELALEVMLGPASPEENLYEDEED